MSPATKASKAAAAREQRLNALKGANRIRNYRAQVKLQIRLGKITIRELGELICDPPEDLEGIEVRSLLECIRSVGPAKAHRILRQLGFNYRTTLACLPEPKRKHLALIIRRFDRSNVVD